jgi:hypothetical protein
VVVPLPMPIPKYYMPAMAKVSPKAKAAPLPLPILDEPHAQLYVLLDEADRAPPVPGPGPPDCVWKLSDSEDDPDPPPPPPPPVLPPDSSPDVKAPSIVQVVPPVPKDLHTFVFICLRVQLNIEMSK